MHNLGAFDGILLISSLERLGILKDSNQVIMRNSSIYEVHISGVVFRDSYKLLPGSLKKLGTELVNMKKGDLDLD